MDAPANTRTVVSRNARRTPRSLWLAIAPLLVLALAADARADLYEGFNYPAGPSFAAGSLRDPSGTLATTGNHLIGGDGLHRPIGPLQTMGTPGTDVWISWLQRRDRNVQGWQGLVLWEPVPSGNRGLFFIGEPGFGPGNGTYVIGSGDDATVVSSNVPAVPNETAFLVAHFQFREGNDLATLYVNPLPGTEPPAGGFTFSGRDMPVIQPSLSLDGMGAGVAHEFDELRISSTYASVAPAVPEPGAPAAALFLALAAAARHRSRNRRAILRRAE